VIVEFMGCSSAGKSTLARAVQAELAACGIPTTGRVAEPSTSALSMRNVLATPEAGARATISSDLRRHLAETARNIRSCSLSPFWTVARTAAAARVIGEHSMQAARTGKGGISLADEGLLTTIQLAFARRAPATDDALMKFAESMVLPDVIVWIDASAQTIVDRTRERSDPPREWRGLSASDLRLFADNTLAAYRSIASSHRVKDVVVAVSGIDSDGARPREETSRVVDAIRSRMP
jgi:thymidylate kinase